MAHKPLVHLIIPQLFQPLKRWGKGYLFEVHSPYLTTLLQGYSSKYQSSANGINASLFASLDIPIQDELPVAHYRYQAHCHSVPPKDSLLLCADPVHLVVGMSDITLTDKITDLTTAEANELIDLLNTHFKQDGLTFTIGSNSQWYLSSSKMESLSTTPLDNVLKKNIAHHPIQSDQRNWQALQNEIQMLLHSAPLNQYRETVGLPTVNSLWLWGGGKRINAKQRPSIILSDNAVSGGMLAIAGKCSYQQFLDKQSTSTLGGIDDTALAEFDFSAHLKGKLIIINESLVESAINDDPEAYQKELKRLEECLFKPLSALWKDKKITIQIDSCGGKLIEPQHTSRWKFWKKRLNSLSELSL